jgi:hypothetical protein
MHLLSSLDFFRPPVSAECTSTYSLSSEGGGLPEEEEEEGPKSLALFRTCSDTCARRDGGSESDLLLLLLAQVSLV